MRQHNALCAGWYAVQANLLAAKSTRDSIGPHMQQRRIYIETSTLNAIASDEYVGNILQFLKRENVQFYVSQTVLQQVMHCRSDDRTRHLLAVLCAFGDRLEVLPFPNTSLRRAARRAHEGRSLRLLDQTVRPTKWLRAICRGGYEVIRADVEESAATDETHRKSLQATYRKSREAFQLHLRADPSPHTRATMMRAARMNPGWVVDMVMEAGDLASRARRLTFAQVMGMESWRAYLLMFGMSAHHAMAAKSDHNPKRMPDPPDIMQAAFLPCVDEFWVDDKRMNRMMRRAARFGGFQQVITSLDELRPTILMKVLSL